MAQTICRLAEAGYVDVCTSAVMIKDSLDKGKIAAIMHIEGAEPIDKDFYNLDMFYRAGLRSIDRYEPAQPVWLRRAVSLSK